MVWRLFTVKFTGSPVTFSKAIKMSSSEYGSIPNHPECSGRHSLPTDNQDTLQFVRLLQKSYLSNIEKIWCLKTYLSIVGIVLTAKHGTQATQKISNIVVESKPNLFFAILLIYCLALTSATFIYGAGDISRIGSM